MAEDIEIYQKVKCDSNFASLCSFLELFGEDLGITLSFPTIVRCVSCSQESKSPTKNWIHLHIRLLNRLRYNVKEDKWENGLRKFCASYSQLDAIDVEQLGYQALPVETKLRILKILLESQFDKNVKLKNKINAMPRANLCKVPIGRDLMGAVYWFLIDADLNFIIFREDTENEKLSVVSETVEEMRQLLANLKTTQASKPRNPYLNLPAIQSSDNSSANVSKSPSPLRENGNKEEDDVELKIDIEEVKLDIEKEVKLEPEIYQEKTGNVSVNGKHEKENIEIEKDLSSESVEAKNVDESKIIDADMTPVNEQSNEPESTEEPTASVSQEPEVQPEVEDENGASEDKVVTPSKSKGRKGRRSEIDNLAESLMDGESPILRRSSRTRTKVTPFTVDVNETSRRKKETVVTPVVTPTKVKKSKEKQQKKSKKKKVKFAKKVKGKRKTGGEPWDRHSSSEEDADEDDFIQALEDEQEDDVAESDGEWTDRPESDFEDDDVDSDDEEVVKKRGRNYQRQKQKEQEIPSPCCVCDKDNLPQWLLLCDSCDDPYHALCLRPPLFLIPDGDWYCPKCQHNFLVESVTAKLTEMEGLQKKREAKARMQERLSFVNVSLTNIIATDKAKRKARAEEGDNSEGEDEEFSSRSQESGSESESGSQSSSSEDSYQRPARATRTTNVNYKFDAFDKMIKEACEEDDKYLLVKDHPEMAVKPPRKESGKDMANILGPDWDKKVEEEPETAEAVDEDEEDIPVEESGRPTPPVVIAKAKVLKNRKKRPLSQLDDFDGSDEGGGSDESFRPSGEDDSVDEKDDEEEASCSSESGDSWKPTRRSSRILDKVPSKSKKSKSKRSKYDSDEEESEDDWRPASKKKRGGRSIGSKFGKKKRKRKSRDYSSEDSDDRPRPARKAARRVVYCEKGSDDDDEDASKEDAGSGEEDKVKRPAVMQKAAFVKKKKKGDDSEDEWKQSDASEEEEEEEEAPEDNGDESEDEEHDKKEEKVKPKPVRKTRIESSEEEEVEDEEDQVSDAAEDEAEEEKSKKSPVPAETVEPVVKDACPVVSAPQPAVPKEVSAPVPLPPISESLQHPSMKTQLPGAYPPSFQQQQHPYRPAPMYPAPYPQRTNFYPTPPSFNPYAPPTHPPAPSMLAELNDYNPNAQQPSGPPSHFYIDSLLHQENGPPQHQHPPHRHPYPPYPGGPPPFR